MIGILFIGITKLYILKAEIFGYKFAEYVDQKTTLDYLIYPTALLIAPLIDHKWISCLWSGSNSGGITLTSIIFAGFILTTYYKTILLAHLTAISYDTPPATVEGMPLLLHRVNY